MGLRPKPWAGRTASCGAGPAGGWLGWNWLVWFGMVGLELGWFGNAIAVFQTAERGPRNSTHFRIILRLENAHASSMPDLVQLSCDAQPRLEICLLPRRLVRGSGGRYYDRLRTGLLQCELDGVHRRHRAQPRGGRLHRGSGKLRGRSPKLRRGLGRDRGNNTISIVSLKTGAVLKTLQLMLQPWLIQASPDGANVYVVTGMFTGNLNHYSSALQVFKARTGALAGNVALPNDGLANPGLAVAPDSSRVYATFDSQTVVVYDVATGMVASTWQTTRALTWTATGTLTLSPDGQTLYTAGQVLTAFDTATGNIQGTVNPPGSSGSYSFVGSAVSSDGGTLYASYAAQIGTGSGLATIDTASLAITGSASLGSELQQPVLSKDGSTLYVPDAIDSLLYVVSASNLAATGSIALQGPIATATLSADGSALYVPNSSTASTLA